MSRPTIHKIIDGIIMSKDDKIRTLELELLQAQRERDEAREINIERADHILEQQIRHNAELTQLRNAVDELVKQLRKADWNCDCYEDEGHRQSCRTITIPAAIELANNLPHRKEKA